MAKLRKNNMLQEEGTLGYKYDVDEDNDESDEELDEDTAEQGFNIMNKVLDDDYNIAENLDEEEMEFIADT